MKKDEKEKRGDKNGCSQEAKEFNHCPEIQVSQDEFEAWCKPWRKALVVRLLGLTVSLGVMQARLNKVWAIRGSIQIVDMPKGYFLVHFTQEEDYNHALFEGPWMVANHYLIVQRWRPLFLSTAKAVQKIAVWITIPNLPIELYNSQFLGRLGAKLGKLLLI